MPRRIFVTGIGVICAAGQNVPQLLSSLQNSQTGIGRIKYVETIHNNFPFAEVKFLNDELLKLTTIKGDTEIFSRTALLGIIAASEAMSSSKKEKNNSIRTGLISATTVAGMPLNEKYYLELLKNDSHKKFIETFDSADSTERIADHLNIKHYIATISTACSSSANAIMVGARMIKHNRLDRVVAGGTDALTKYTINGFNALEILDSNPCRPFDANRKGLTLGEGAAFLMLEAEDIADPDSIICELKGYGNANDAFHSTASSPDGNGASLAMKKAIDSAGLNIENISYINAHGTGTDINDLSEGKAMMMTFGKNIPLVSSTKAFIGHTLAAAGAVEAVISALAIKHQFIPANLNFKDKIDELSFEPVITLMNDYPVHHVLSNSFGFGGNNTSLIFSAC